MVAVRMVSEGVDVPRLSVGVYATSTSTPLFFAQAVGRFVRARRRGETASVFLPSVPLLLDHANGMEVERDHALGRPLTDDGNLWATEDVLVAEANATRSENSLDDQLAFEALESEAEFDRVLFDGDEFGAGAAIGSEEEADFLGLPGLLEPDQVSVLLKQRQAEQLSSGRFAKRTATVGTTTHRTVGTLRKELNSMVGAWHHRTGQPHGVIHAELRRVCGGPPAAQADPAQLQARIDALRNWAIGRR